jgi:hypothetical protein
MAEALEEARLHLDRTWAELSDDWRRAVAMRPPGSKVRARRCLVAARAQPLLVAHTGAGWP